MEDDERPWPPKTIREWIALQKHDAKQSWFWEGETAWGYLEAVRELEHFLDRDWTIQLGGPNDGDVFPERTTPPPVE